MDGPDWQKDVLIRKWSQQRCLLARDVNQRNLVLTNDLWDSVRVTKTFRSCRPAWLEMDRKFCPTDTTSLQLFVGIYLAFCLICYTLKKYQDIKKSQNPGYLAQACLPQRQWMNYTTYWTMMLQSIHCPLRGKRL